MSELKDWEQCGIWKRLVSKKGSHAEECRTTLRSVMPEIQEILNSGGTAPKDFTLHDAGHSFRVAERMLHVAGATAKILTEFELMLLILSAYLHDIGMTPKFEKVNKHFTYVLTGSADLLTTSEISELQTWLDDSGYQIVPPIPGSVPLVDRLSLAREITTFYCRHRHNDWSADWIRENLANLGLSSYTGLLEDLVLLCQSHHFGMDRLIQPSFRARRVASPSEVVNLRFLALVLRTADVLDFDPERTPEIILRHRDIVPESQIYWWKDKEISMQLCEGRLVVSARPSSARIHRAIEETVDAIDAELALCRKIADDYPLGALPGEKELPYIWSMPASCHRDIEPREGTYEYIDGAFRPDTQKLLSLLSGTALYQTPFHAVRELVQNAFDAIAERIAYLKLENPNPSSTPLAKQLAQQHRVTLQIETEGADAYLTCTDTGIGMTKSIITDRILVSGSSPRHDVRVLDRRCKQAGFDLGRSGQFGIGVLSYFMIASHIEIETLRALEPGDSDSTRWHFETGGVGGFGELRKVGGNFPGTRVRLRLNREISADPTTWYTELRHYLLHTLVYCPCEFNLNSPLPHCMPLEIKPGWSPRDYVSACTRPLHSSRMVPPDELRLLSGAEREKRLASQREVVQLEEEIKSCLKWRTVEGYLSGRLAHYVLEFPYFQIQGNASLAFFRARRDDHNQLLIDRFQNGTYLRPPGETEEAWKGMVISRSTANHMMRGRQFRFDGFFLRLNWISSEAGEIMANRDEFHAKSYETAKQEIRNRSAEMVRQFIEEFKDSEFTWFNERVANTYLSAPSQCRWLRENASDKGGD